jgi:hypothetical protein
VELSAARGQECPRHTQDPSATRWISSLVYSF